MRTLSDTIVLDKQCPTHGPQSVVLSTDLTYWADAQLVLANRPPLTPIPGMLVLDVVEECDFGCPMCIASSVPGLGQFRARSELSERVAKAAEKYRIPILALSGGEPTLHPFLVEIIGDLLPLVERVSLITNGAKIARDVEFVARLRELGPKLEVYLQFDSLQQSALIDLRGGDHRRLRLDATKNLADASVRTTLVSVVKKTVNDTEVGSIVRFALGLPNVAGVTFQPIRSSGRHRSFSYQVHSVTLSEVRRQLLEDLSLPPSALIPHPISPERVCIGYVGGGSEDVIDLTSGLVLAGLNQRLLGSLFPLQEAVHLAPPQTRSLRVAIVSYLDRNDHTIEAANESPVSYLTVKGEVIPLDTHFL